MSYHGSSLALSPMTPSWRAWIKQEARTHLNVRQIFTSKTHPRPYFLHFVQHVSNRSTKKSPVIRTDNQPTETHLDTKKFTIPIFFFYSHQAISDGCLHLRNSRSLAECLHLQPPRTAQGGRSGSGEQWTLWMAPLTFSAQNKVSL